MLEKQTSGFNQPSRTINQYHCIGGFGRILFLMIQMVFFYDVKGSRNKLKRFLSRLQDKAEEKAST